MGDCDGGVVVVEGACGAGVAWGGERNGEGDETDVLEEFGVEVDSGHGAVVFWIGFWEGGSAMS